MTALALEAGVAIPLASSAAFGLLAPPASRRMPPRAAIWLLSAGSVLLAASTVGALGIVVVGAAGALRPVAWVGDWSARLIAAGEPFGPAAASLAAVALALQVLLAGGVSWRRARGLVAAWEACRACSGPLVVLADPEPEAFAVPGWPGRIVATSGLLTTFSPPQRRAVLAHEQAHLDARHDLHLAAVAIAAAADPLLCLVPRAARLATERAADEVAARATGDRDLVADAIGRVVEGRRYGKSLTLAFGASDAERRVRALSRRPPRRRPGTTAALAGLGLVAVVSTMVAGHDVVELFQAAMHHPVALAAGP